MLFRSDRKSTRLNSSHLVISYAVFCLKKKKRINKAWREEWLRHRGRFAHACPGACCVIGDGLPCLCPSMRASFSEHLFVFFFLKAHRPALFPPFPPPPLSPT